MPAAIRTAIKTNAAIPGYWKLRRRLSIEVRRQANSGPAPVKNSRKRPMGTMRRLYQSASSEILSPVAYSEITGNRVPQRTAKQLASRIRLLNRKLDSRETTLSSFTSLLRYGRLRIIAKQVRTVP